MAAGGYLKKEQTDAFVAALKVNYSVLIPPVGSRSADEAAEDYVKAIIRTCDDVLIRKGNVTERKAAYWWNDEIRKARVTCNKARRKLKALRGDDNSEARKEIFDQLKEDKKTLRVAISESKQQKWNDVLKELNTDPLSKGYKIAMGKLEGRKPTPELNDPDTVIGELFPRDDYLRETEKAEEIEKEMEGEPDPF